MPDLSLAEINRSVFATLLPETHGEKKKSKKADKPSFTEAEIAACTAAGVDPATLNTEELAAVVAAASLGK